jgi:NTP pyrophosphatase (non-canonical NTP hydrolase)
LPFLHRFSPWERLRKSVCRWADQTFPKDRSSLIPKALHLREEVDELIDALAHEPPQGHPYAIAQELGDIVIIAMHVAHCRGIDLYEAVRQKFDLVRARTWLPPDENGVIRHKK